MSRSTLIGLVLLAIGVGALLKAEVTRVPPFRSRAVRAATDTLGTKLLSPRIAELARQSRVEVIDKLPLVFEANQGQTDPEVDFLSRNRGYNLFLTATCVEMSLALSQSAERTRPTISSSISSPTYSSIDVRRKSTTIRMNLLGANPHSKKVGLEKLPGKVNYFLGNESAKWHSEITTYAKVKYQEVYRGVDLLYYGHRHELEYDFVVAPRADPKEIRLDFEGAEELKVDVHGNVVLQAAEGPVVELHKPFAYQEIDGVRREVSSGYVLDKRRVSFHVGSYDLDRPLIIDPVLVYSTKLGGGNEEAGWAIALDSAGDVYVVRLQHL